MLWLCLSFCQRLWTEFLEIIRPHGTKPSFYLKQNPRPSMTKKCLMQFTTRSDLHSLSLKRIQHSLQSQFVFNCADFHASGKNWRVSLFLWKSWRLVIKWFVQNETEKKNKFVYDCRPRGSVVRWEAGELPYVGRKSCTVQSLFEPHCGNCQKKLYCIYMCFLHCLVFSCWEMAVWNFLKYEYFYEAFLRVFFDVIGRGSGFLIIISFF